MSTLNPYFQNYTDNQEQDLYQELTTELIQIYGKDCYYIPRRNINDRNASFLSDDRKNQSYIFDTVIETEMFPESIDGFEGQGNLFEKFGFEIRDQIIMAISKERWNSDFSLQLSSSNYDRPRPYEGDLVDLPFSNALFEIRFVEHEKPFYQLNQYTKYTLTLEKYEYSGELFNTGIEEIDQVEYRHGLSSGINFNAILSYHDLPLLSDEFLKSYFIGKLLYLVNEDVSPLVADTILHLGKIYEIDTVSSSPLTFNISIGQYTAIESVSDNMKLAVIDSDGEIESVIEIVDLLSSNIDDSESDDVYFPNDPSAENISIERKAEDIIDFSEKNPFGEF